MLKLTILATLFSATLLSSCSSPEKATAMLSPDILNGTWTLVEYPELQSSLDALYPMKKPNITFDVAGLKINGSTGCNSFNGPFKISQATIDFSAPLGITRMMCPGEGESTFIRNLQKANGWTVRDNTLRLMAGDLVIMKLDKSTP